MQGLTNSESLVFNIRGNSVAAKVWGDKSGYPVIALHGWLDNAASFDRVAPFLKGCYVVAPDFSGHGLSGHRESATAYYLWEYALDINDLVIQMKLSNFTVLAHSMGSGVASILCAINTHIDTLIFLDGMGAPFTIKLEDTVEHFKRAYRISEMASRSDATRANMIQFSDIEEAAQNRTQGVGGSISLQAAKLLVERDLVDKNGSLMWRHDPELVYPEPIQLTHQQAAAFVKQIKCPLYILLGREGLFSKVVGERSNYLPDQAEISWFDGGHHFHLDSPSDNFISVILSIINKTNVKEETPFKLIGGASQ